MAKIIDENEKKQINLNILQKEDKNITSILGNASHIVIYKFDNNKTIWDRVGVEGSAFVVLASTIPYLRLLVLNRLSILYYNHLFSFSLLLYFYVYIYFFLFKNLFFKIQIHIHLIYHKLLKLNFNHHI